MIITVKKKHWWDKLLDLIFDTKDIEGRKQLLTDGVAESK